jgi:hypothetical protein
MPVGSDAGGDTNVVPAVLPGSGKEPMIEKRQYPRVRTRLPLKLGAVASARVHDISRAGIRCITASPLAPMTMVGLLLEIPEDDRDTVYVEVPCQGVVVRSRVLETEETPSYEAAILFQDLEETAQRTIEAYVNRHLEATAS